MPSPTHPRRGSLGYKPKKKSKTLTPSFKNWKDSDNIEPLGFGGYKAGMTRLMMVDDKEGSASKGAEVAQPVTVIEVPPLTVYGLRAYSETPHGKKTMMDILAENLSTDLKKKITLPKKGNPEKVERLKDNLDSISDFKLLVHTNPNMAGISKKKPDVFEVAVGGYNIKDKLETCQEMLDTNIEPESIFDNGEYVDVLSVTKGKGFQGAVQRHGVKVLPHNSQKKRRRAGNLGPWHPDKTSWKVPQAGRSGVNRRTEINKRILKIGDEPDQINPDSGFKKYGEVKSKWIAIKGSVPGPAKRFIGLRSALRKEDYKKDPKITYIAN